MVYMVSNAIGWEAKNKAMHVEHSVFDIAISVKEPVNPAEYGKILVVHKGEQIGICE
jgi:hypothetical protein